MMEDSEVISPLELQSSLSVVSDSNDGMILDGPFENFEQEASIKEGEQDKTIRVCYKIFLTLLQTNILDKYLSKFKIAPDKQPTLRKYSPLCCYLYKVKYKPKKFVLAQLHSSAIEEIANVFNKKMNAIWEEMSSQLKHSYETAVKKNKEYFKAGHFSHIFSQAQNEQKNLYRLNVLSLFFKSNKNLMKLVKASKMQSIIKKNTIQKFFRMNPAQYDRYWTRYQSFSCQLAYPFFEQFEEIIILTSLVDLKYRIGNFISKSKEKQKIAEPPHPISFKEIRDFFKDKPDSDQFKYSFSQLVFSTNGDNFSNRSILVKSKIIEEMAAVTQLPNINERKQLFLHIKITYDLSLISLHAIYRSIVNQNNQEEGCNIFKALKHDQQNAEWIHAKTKRFPKSLKKLVFHTQSFNLVYDNHVLLTLFNKSAERKKILQEQVLLAQLKIEQNLKRKPIFASLQYISNRDAKQLSNVNSSASLKGQQETKYCIVILSTSKRVLAGLVMQNINVYDYFDIINEYFKAKDLRGRALVLLENIYNPMYGNIYHNFMSHYFARQYDTSIYISNMHSQYLYHQSICSSIIRSLMINSTHIRQQNFRLILSEVVRRKLGKIGKIIRSIIDDDQDMQ